MAGKAELVVRLDCSWRRVEPDGQTCLVCGDVIWLGPLELFMAVEGEQLRATGCFVCQSCGEEGDFKA